MSAAPVLTSLKNFKLEILKGPHQGEVFQFQKPVITAGRGDDNDLCLRNDPKVSRFHFEIKQEDGLLTIHNISQKNFLYVNGLKIQNAPLENNSRLQVGDTEFIFKLISVRLATAEMDQATVRISAANSAGPSNSQPTVASTVSYAVAIKTDPKPRPLNVAFPEQPSFQNQQQSYRPLPSASAGQSRVRFYSIVGAVLLVVGYLFLMPDTKKEKSTLRQSEAAFKEMAAAESNIQTIQKDQQKSGADTPQLQLALQHYLKGFRDYRQGQYGRSILSFQAALSFYPQHDLSKKYLVLARKRFDEIVKFNMNQGRLYKSKDNYRLCADAFSKVIVMLKDPSDPTYKEAKLYFDECSMKVQGRY